MTNQSNTDFLNWLKVLACFAVVMIHTVSPLNVYYKDTFSDTEAYICVVLRNLWQWCIPLFLMISGTLFLSVKNISLDRMLKKYVLRIVLALFLFGIPFAYMEHLFSSGYVFSPNDILLSAQDVFTGNSWVHLWYLYVIIGIYLITPMLKTYVTNADRKQVKYLLILLFAFTSALPLCSLFFGFTTAFHLPISSVYLFYFILGYYIFQYDVTIPLPVLLGMLFLYFALTFAAAALPGVFISGNNGMMLAWEYNSPIVAMCAFSLFCLFRQYAKSNQWINRFVPLTFGIYLIHKLFTNVIYRFFDSVPDKFPLPVIIAGVFVFSLVAAALCTILLRKLAFVKKHIL
ncbi:MAG: acyltransferase family protein [Clostridiales Family XIII bacterium]|nr:acyltransferase family protein [Clostridiales Family XIII bacterium]